MHNHIDKFVSSGFSKLKKQPSTYTSNLLLLLLLSTTLFYKSKPHLSHNSGNGKTNIVIDSILPSFGQYEKLITTTIFPQTMQVTINNDIQIYPMAILPMQLPKYIAPKTIVQPVTFLPNTPIKKWRQFSISISHTQQFDYRFNSRATSSSFLTFYDLTNRTSVGAGLIYTKNSRIRLMPMTQKFSYLEVPLLIKYRIAELNRLSANTTFGTSLSYMLGTTSKLIIEDGEGNLQTLTTIHTEPLKSVYAGAIIKIGAEYSIAPSIQFKVEPFFKTAITSVYNHTYPFSVGLDFGISYHF